MKLANMFARPISVPPLAAARNQSRPESVAVIRIKQRDSIPIAEHHVLVMEGMSTYVFEHARGASFVIDSSIYNVDHDRQYNEAVDAAKAMARVKGLPAIYVLE